MIRPIVIYPDTRLREKTSDILIPTSHTTRILVEDLVETMRSHKGLGIAAPQIGVSLNVFVIDLALFDKANILSFRVGGVPIEPRKHPLAFINPQIVDT